MITTSKSSNLTEFVHVDRPGQKIFSALHRSFSSKCNALSEEDCGPLPRPDISTKPSVQPQLFASPPMSASDPVLERDARDALVMAPVPVTTIARLATAMAPMRDRHQRGLVPVVRAWPWPRQRSVRMPPWSPRIGRVETLRQPTVLLRRPGLRGAVMKFRDRDPGGRHVVVRRSATLYHRGVPAQDCNAGVGVEQPQRSTSRPLVRRFIIRFVSVAGPTSDVHLPANLRHAAT